MTQHEDLDLVGPLAPRGECEQLQDEPDNHVSKREDHNRQHPRTRRPALAQSRTRRLGEVYRHYKFS
jgi:hypothetical protein